MSVFKRNEVNKYKTITKRHLGAFSALFGQKDLLRHKVLLSVISILFLLPINFKDQVYGYTEERKLGVVVTILPQKDFVDKLGREKVKVTVMVPPGASPHSYEPNPSQLVEVSEARMYAKVGSGVEFETVWFDRIMEANRDMLVVDCSEGIELIETGEPGSGQYDPHIWLSPRNAKLMVENIYKGLIEIDPENRDYYRTNKEKYTKELDDLDSEIDQALSGEEGKEIIVYHPAWTYFVRDYGLKQLSLEEEGKEPTPKVISNLIKQAKENNIKVIITSPQFSTKSAEVVADEINGRAILVNPLPEDYIGDLSETLGAVINALETNE